MSTEEAEYRCWQCGELIAELRFPVSRREECRHCRAEIHVCRQCKQYAANVADQCREDRAEAVTDKTRANFCDYFDINADAWQPADTGGQSAARAAAEALFGDADSKPAEPGSSTANSDPAAKAREELKRLFGDD